MQYQIIKLTHDAPFDTLEPYCRYGYTIEFKVGERGGMTNFHEVRKWLVEAYGWSDKIGDAVTNTDNEYWTWIVHSASYRIYLRSDKELMFFKLKFTNNDLV